MNMDNHSLYYMVLGNGRETLYLTEHEKLMEVVEKEGAVYWTLICGAWGQLVKGDKGAGLYWYELQRPFKVIHKESGLVVFELTDKAAIALIVAKTITAS